VVEDAFKNARRCINFRGFIWIMALSLRFFPLDGTAQRSPKRCLGAKIVSASCTGDKGMPVGRCMAADSTIAAHYSHMAASARSVHRERSVSQAAISLENARLYSDLQEREARISQQPPDCFRICRLGEEQPQSGFGVHDDGADRLVDFGNRRR
jgi:D-serine dehydratase